MSIVQMLLIYLFLIYIPRFGFSQYQFGAFDPLVDDQTFVFVFKS